MFGTLLKRKSTRSAPFSQDKPAPLSDRHLILLSRAAARDDRTVVLPDDHEASDINEALSLLMARGLIERTAEGDGVSFRINAAGLAHIGLSDDDTELPSSPHPTLRDEHSSAPDATLAPVSALEPAPASVALNVEPTDGAALQAEQATGSASAAQPRSWRKRPPSASSSTKDKGAETKQASSASSPTPSRKTALIALLQRPDGTTLGQVRSTFGWLPHSARAALSGLRKAGHRIERKVGPEGKEAVYRIVEQVAESDAPSAADETTASLADAV